MRLLFSIRFGPSLLCFLLVTVGAVLVDRRLAGSVSERDTEAAVLVRVPCRVVFFFLDVAVVAGVAVLRGRPLRLLGPLLSRLSFGA